MVVDGGPCLSVCFGLTFAVFYFSGLVLGDAQSVQVGAVASRDAHGSNNAQRQDTGLGLSAICRPVAVRALCRIARPPQSNLQHVYGIHCTSFN